MNWLDFASGLCAGLYLGYLIASFCFARARESQTKAVRHVTEQVTAWTRDAGYQRSEFETHHIHMN